MEHDDSLATADADYDKAYAKADADALAASGRYDRYPDKGATR